MRVTLTIAVLFAVVATAMVAVCEHSEVCRLRYRLWEVERRHNALDRQLRELDAELAENDTPAALLRSPAAHAVGRDDASTSRPATSAAEAPAALLGSGRDLRWYEGGRR